MNYCSSRALMKLNRVRVTRILLMDKLWPRGSPSSLMSFSTSLLADRFALFLCNRLQRPLLRCTISRTHSYLYYDNQYCHSSPQNSTTTMDKNPKDTTAPQEEAIKDQEREVHGKSACDNDPSNRAFDHILPHLLNIYASRGTPQDFEIYAPDATFEDPLMRAQGIKQIKSAFYSLSKVFGESRIVEYSIKENVISPGKKEILMDNKQYYKFLGKDINMISLIKLHLEDGKIVRHEDWWDKKPLWNRETVQLPLVGRITEMTRRASMLATHVLMGFGKDPSN